LSNSKKNGCCWWRIYRFRDGSVWSRLGSEVHVVEFLEHITPGMDREISLEFMKILKKQGIKFHMQHKVEKFKKITMVQ
jgi:pyruvate/2-oxoglutarate dehydrogenase complex dihydrolipoamide dehydrogenase (E3) component